MSQAEHLLHLGRICAPAETVARVRPHMPALGITRLARQTGLDRIGIPVWAAVRPNSLSLAVNQGKGVDDAAACASALMEAAEYAIAERPDAPVREASQDEIAAAGDRAFVPVRQLAPGASLPRDKRLSWLPARRLCDDTPFWVPFEAVRMDHTAAFIGDMVRSSNGLASGNDRREAVLHAVCELVERDAQTLAAFRNDRAVTASRIDPALFGSRLVDRLCERIRDAGFAVALFDLTTDVAVPVIRAVIQDRALAVRRQFDLAAGSGCHPFAPHAAVRAITEAVQTRITNIAGARDDIDPAEYGERLRDGLTIHAAVTGERSARTPPASLVSPHDTPAGMLEAVTRRLAAARVPDVILADLGGSAYGMAVVKAFAPQLEDRAVNRHWRPGPRLAGSLLRP